MADQRRSFGNAAPLFQEDPLSIFDTVPDDTDPEILFPNRYSESLHMWFIQCPCGGSPGQHGGFLDTHFPSFGVDGSTPLADPFGEGSTCRYSGRSLTLAAAIARDGELTKAERYVRNTVRTRREYQPA